MTTQAVTSTKSEGFDVSSRYLRDLPAASGALVRAVHYHEDHLFVLEKKSIECRDVENLLGDYTARELPPTLKGRLDAHLHGCAQCTKLKADYERTIELARQLRDRPVPQEVHERLKSALTARLGIQLRS